MFLYDFRTEIPGTFTASVLTEIAAVMIIKNFITPRVILWGFF